MDYTLHPEAGSSGEVPALNPADLGRQDDASQPPRYDANLRLIRRRLADEKRTGGKVRRWWNSKS